LRVGIVLKPKIDEKLKKLFFEVRKIFKKYDMEVLVELNSAKAVGILGTEFNQMCQNADFLVSLGGDGTLISLARRSYEYNKPILGINAGKLGFLTDVNPDNLDEFLHDFIKGKYRVDERMVIEVEYNGNYLYAFNDVVISKDLISSMVHINVDTNESFLNSYYGDGLIISTPTGSTAYNLSAGGPVVYPLTEGFVLTPICPHSLTQRPLILPSKFEIVIEAEENTVKLIIDGQEIYDMKKIKIKKAKKPAKLIHRLERNYFEVLREKLNWGYKS